MPSSRTSRRRASSPQPLPGEPGVSRVNGQFFGGGWGGLGQGWNGADYSADRGYVYWPQMDSRRDLPTFSREEQLRRSRYLDANVGFAGRINRGIARMIAGTGLMVRPTTRNPEWNKLRADLFRQRNGHAGVVDLARKWDFYSMQRGLLEMRNIDGDIGTVFTKSASGLARLSFIEAHRIANGKMSRGEMDRIFDGVLVDRNNAPVAYRVLGDDDAQADIPAVNFCYLGTSVRPGRHRSPPICHRAINHMVDMTEMNRYLKKGAKNAARMAYYISTQAGQVQARKGLPVSPVDRTKRDTPAGKRVNVDQILDGGGEIPDLDPGQEVRMLLDERPHPNTLGFYEHLARDISWGTDWPPEILWAIAALGSANIRYLMAEGQSLTEVGQQELIDAVLARYYLYDTCLEVATGRLPPCPDPQWYRHEFIPPARWTIDRGRDGKLHLEMVRSGALTFRRMLGWEGLDSEVELNEWMDEMKWIAEGAKQRGLDAAFVLDRIYARVGAAPATDTGTPGADEDGAPAANPRKRQPE
jgi:hypothetical protein